MEVNSIDVSQRHWSLAGILYLLPQTQVKHKVYGELILGDQGAWFPDQAAREEKHRERRP